MMLVLFVIQTLAPPNPGDCIGPLRADPASGSSFVSSQHSTTMYTGQHIVPSAFAMEEAYGQVFLLLEALEKARRQTSFCWNSSHCKRGGSAQPQG